MLVVRRHDSQKYSTVFSQETGFFARIEDQGTPEPSWSANGPELLDVSLTSWCDQGCSFCYRKSTTDGVHMTRDDIDWLLSEASSAGVHQIAFGGGNPNQHPDFPEIIRETRRSFNIVPSYTTNGRGLSKSVLKATAEHCGGVAVSAYPPYDQTERAIERLTDHGVQTNVHQVFAKQTIPQILDWLRDPPSWLIKSNALILLNYKPVPWDKSGFEVAAKDPRWREVIRLATAERYPFRVGFDNCCITGLLQEANAHPASIEPCDAARFSMFVSEHLEAHPCSFMAELRQGAQLKPHGLLHVWQTDPMFRQFRGHLQPSECGRQSSSPDCLGGCHLFPEINFCQCGQQKRSVLDSESDLVPLSISATQRYS